MNHDLWALKQPASFRAKLRRISDFPLEANIDEVSSRSDHCLLSAKNTAARSYNCNSDSMARR